MNYSIINCKKPNFKPDTCQRIDPTKGKIIEVSNETVDYIAAIFDALRKTGELTANSRDLANANIKRDFKKRILSNPNLTNNGGYIGTIAIITASIIILSAIIFLGIGNLLGR